MGDEKPEEQAVILVFTRRELHLMLPEYELRTNIIKIYLIIGIDLRLDLN